jgi:inhibitor of KinA
MADTVPSDGNQAEYPRIVPVGDSAILVEFGSGIDPEINSRVYSFADRVEAAANSAVVEMVPTYRSLLVQYNPLSARYDQMMEFLGEVEEAASEASQDPTVPTVVELPVVYGGDDGPDLDSVADHAGVSSQDVIDVHSGTGYRVYMVGFAPGFPYLGGLDERIACPRLKTPRLKVPAGSVGIAESQTGVYPNASPGGWQIIGRTAVPLFDAASASPSLITPGAEVRFVPVDAHG